MRVKEPIYKVKKSKKKPIYKVKKSKKKPIYKVKKSKKKPIYKVRKSKKKPIYKIIGGEPLASQDVSSQDVSSQQRLTFIGSLIKETLQQSLMTIIPKNPYINIEELIKKMLLRNFVLKNIQELAKEINEQIELGRLMIWNAIIGFVLPIPVISGQIRNANNSIHQLYETIDAFKQFDSILKEIYEILIQEIEKAEANPKVIEKKATAAAAKAEDAAIDAAKAAKEAAKAEDAAIDAAKAAKEAAKAAAAKAVANTVANTVPAVAQAVPAVAQAVPAVANTVPAVAQAVPAVAVPAVAVPAVAVPAVAVPAVAEPAVAVPAVAQAELAPAPAKN